MAAPRPRAAALVSTSSRDTIALAGVVEEGGAAGAAGVGGTTTGGTVDGCLIPDPCLLKSSNIVCWSAFFSPCNSQGSI